MQRLVKLFIPKRTMSTLEKISYGSRDIRAIIPPMTTEQHKGQSGRIGVIGGSREYTGAPYFAAMSCLRLGADLAHVFCSESAGTAIKGYSADLIVHPILDDIDALEQLKEWLPRLHAVVLGPGLGRDPKIMNLTVAILNFLKATEKLTVIDADGLFVVTKQPGILKEFKNLILTPNIIEYKRLIDAVTGGEIDSGPDESIDFLVQNFKDLTVVKKGPVDQVFNSKYLCEVGGGSARRCGGQGDVLSGSIALFSYWAQLANSDLILGAFSGCSFVRDLNLKVYHNKRRSMVTGDFIEKIGEVFEQI